jgi:hypothetical protein
VVLGEGEEGFGDGDEWWLVVGEEFVGHKAEIDHGGICGFAHGSFDAADKGGTASVIHGFSSDH